MLSLKFAAFSSGCMYSSAGSRRNRMRVSNPGLGARSRRRVAGVGTRARRAGPRPTPLVSAASVGEDAVAGPLESLKVVELVGIGPGPFAAMLLADMGADVLRVHRVESVERGYDPGGVPVLDRNRRSVGVDLKRPEGVETVLRLVKQAEAL